MILNLCVFAIRPGLNGRTVFKCKSLSRLLCYYCGTVIMYYCLEFVQTEVMNAVFTGKMRTGRKVLLYNAIIRLLACTHSHKGPLAL